MLFTSLAVLALAAVPTSYAAPAKKCVKPAVRKEWRSLKNAEKAAFIKAVNCLAKLPHDPKLKRTFPTDQRIPEIRNDTSYYDDLVYLHIDLNRKFRGTALFFPWHRWYTHKFEEALQTKCGYKGTSPYWNWSLDAEDTQHATIWDDDPTHGLGSWGDATDDFSVKTGGFKDLIVNYPTTHHIRRNYTITPYKFFNVSDVIPEPARQANATFTQAKVDFAVHNCTDGDYQCLQTHCEGQQNMGGGAHSIVGGDLGGICPATGPSYCLRGAEFTSNEPMFHLHHANLDRIWATWQAKNAINANAFYGGSVQNYTTIKQWPIGQPPNATKASFLPADGLFGPEEDTIEDVMSTTGGILCYKYDLPAA